MPAESLFYNIPIPDEPAGSLLDMAAISITPAENLLDDIRVLSLENFLTNIKKEGTKVMTITLNQLKDFCNLYNAVDVINAIKTNELNVAKLTDEDLDKYLKEKPERSP